MPWLNEEIARTRFRETTVTKMKMKTKKPTECT
jgi:hypothetical protein